MSRANHHGGGSPRKTERNAQLYRAFLALPPENEHKLRYLAGVFQISKARVWMILHAEGLRHPVAATPAAKG